MRISMSPRFGATFTLHTGLNGEGGTNGAIQLIHKIPVGTAKLDYKITPIDKNASLETPEVKLMISNKRLIQSTWEFLQSNGVKFDYNPHEWTQENPPRFPGRD